MSRVMEVIRIDEDDIIHTAFFQEREWRVIINSFFIEGGLDIPNKIDSFKTLDELSDADYSILFEELGYSVTGITEYDPELHIACSYPLPKNKKENNA